MKATTETTTSFRLIEVVHVAGKVMYRSIGNNDFTWDWLLESLEPR